LDIEADELLKQWLKKWVFRLLGKDPEGVLVTFCTGDAELCRRMAEEVQRLVPDRRHFLATDDNWPAIRQQLRRYRIGLAVVMLTRRRSVLRRAAYGLAPRKILAYNSRLERHHLRLDLASFLFWRGVPLDRIYLRPWWWPWPHRDRSVAPRDYRLVEGRPCTDGRRRVAVLSPYLPYPLAHGGAVRIFNLLREMAFAFDVELFAFTDTDQPETAPLLQFCARLVLVGKPRYREPRWSSLLPPEIHEFRSCAMRRALAVERRAFGFELLQVEYTQLAEYGRDILVEHDVTYDLFQQVAQRNRTLAARWDYLRWRRFERRAAHRYRSVIVMSKKDAQLLAGEAKPAATLRLAVIENGVDFERFQAQPETPAEELLFIGSFRHFPNIAAYRFFVDQVWPLLRDLFPNARVTAVCGPDYLVHWKTFTDTPEPRTQERIRLLGFVSDVRPLYIAGNVVLVPTPVSAGTNVKVLEAMAMRRAVVSTSCGCAGLDLIHGESVWVGDTAETFAEGVGALLANPQRRAAMALQAYEHVASRFGWRKIGLKQRDLLRQMLEERAGAR
jgi:glycosyltransferase involved in cell wall biosynthesis